MVGASKILTVSYGTFSCTLEGFDDPFNTMRAIAEYFRDLAAEDRYFGAEPPTPDAAMLHKIAEREIQRRVEAKIQDNGVILRAGEAGEAAVLLPQATRADLAEPAATVPVAEAAAVAAEPEAATPPAISESVAAKLMRIRSAVAQSQAPSPVQPSPPAPQEDQADYIEDEDVGAATDEAAGLIAAFADTGFSADEEVAQAAEIEAPLPEEDQDQLADLIAAEDALPEDFASAADEALEEAAEDFVAETPWTDEALQAAFEEPLDEPTETAAEALAAAAQDDDALLANLAGLAASEGPAEDEVGEDEVVAEAAFEDEEDTGGLTAPDDAPVAAEPGEDEDLSGLLPSLPDTDEAAAEEDLPPLAGPAEILDDEFEEDLDEDFEESIFEESIEDNLAESPAPVAEGPTDEEAEESASEPPAAAEELEIALEKTAVLEKAMRARARVIKIRRADAPTAAPAEDSATLSPEAEADLMRELAEAASDPASQPGTPPVTPGRPVTGEGRRKLDDNAEEDAVNRLIAQTNTEMAGPEIRRRVSAIAHLKAAVAATVADRRAGGTPAPTEADRIDPYRNDLSHMVRPSGPAAADRPSPLVLVSEQRIDRRPEDKLAAAAQPAEAARTIVRPRRVGASSNLAMRQDDLDDEDDDLDDDGNLFSDTKGFAEFADRLGAEGLPALIEAAAAYSACVEGRPHFTRPQLFRQIGPIALDAGFTRENSLRGFGSLLRTGKIVKVKRGQYALSEGSHYLAEARKLVG